MMIEISKLLALSSSIFGVIGTIMLSKYSFSLQSYEGAVWGGDAVTEFNENVKQKNKKRVTYQKIALKLLVFSFFLSGLSVFF